MIEPSCVRQTLIPGTSKLFDNYLYDFDRVSPFYHHNFADPQALRAAASELKYPAARREQIVAALREQNGDSEALRELQHPDCMAVVTGQQVGLLSGPSYTIFKALTAVRLVAQLRAEGLRAVPVFWLASEDHDLAEVNHAWLFDSNFTPQKITAAGTTANGGPVGEAPVGDLTFSEIRAALNGLPFAAPVIKKLWDHYHPGARFGPAFKGLLSEILDGFGILYLDPLAPAIREIARPFLAGAAERVPELLPALRARDGELAKVGYHSQVHLDEDASLLFLLGDGKRTALRFRDGQFVSRDAGFRPGDVTEAAGRLSPNALLRPVMQDFLLPTVTYVAGPSEIAYMAQSEVLYSRLLGRMPVIFPRNSFTLLDTRAEKLMTRHGFRLTDLLDHEEKVKGRIASRLVPPGLAQELESLEASTSSAITKLEITLRKFDPTLESAARKSAAKIRYQVQKLAAKTARETLRRDQRSAADAGYLMNSVYPQRHLQERFYSIVPFLAKYGFDLPRQIFEMTQLTCPDHMVRTV